MTAISTYEYDTFAMHILPHDLIDADFCVLQALIRKHDANRVLALLTCFNNISLLFNVTRITESTVKTLRNLSSCRTMQEKAHFCCAEAVAESVHISK